jgi:hypothetical protein
MTIRNREFLVGVVFLALGAIGLILSSQYSFAVGNRVGPGAFPAILAGIMTCLGVVQCVAAYRTVDGTPTDPVRWLPMALVAAAVVVFGVLIDHIGAIPALAISAVIAGFAGGKPNYLHIAAVFVAVSAFAAFVVVDLLGMQLPLFGWH